MPRVSDHPPRPCRPTWSERLPPLAGPQSAVRSFSSRHLSALLSLSTMSAVVQTASPHLRVSAAKASSTVETPSARIPPPEPSSVDDKFFWTYTEEPHRSRRQAIIKAHPEVRPSFGPKLRTCDAPALVNLAAFGVPAEPVPGKEQRYPWFLLLTSASDCRLQSSAVLSPLQNTLSLVSSPFNSPVHTSSAVPPCLTGSSWLQHT